MIGKETITMEQTRSQTNSPHELQDADEISQDHVLIDSDAIRSRNLIQRTSLPSTTTFTGLPKVKGHGLIDRSQSNNPSAKSKPKVPIKPLGLSTFIGGQTCRAPVQHRDLSTIVNLDQTNPQDKLSHKIHPESKGLALIAGDSLESFKSNCSIPSTDAEQDNYNSAETKTQPIIKPLAAHLNDHASVDINKSGQSVSSNADPIPYVKSLPTSADQPSILKKSLNTSQTKDDDDDKRRHQGTDPRANSPAKRTDNNPNGKRNGPNQEKQVIIAPAPKNEEDKPPFMFAGLIVAVAGSVFFSCSTLFVKLVGETNSFEDKMQAVLSRAVLVTAFCGISIVVQKGTIKIARDEILINFVRAVFGYLAILGAYMSYRYISLGDSTALLFLSPVWTSILSHFILGEPLRCIIFLVLPVSLFGTVLIAHPTLIFDVGPDECDLMQMEPSIASKGDTAIDFQTYNLTLVSDTNLNLHRNITKPCTEPFDISVRWPGVALALATSLCMSIVYIVLKFRKSTPILTTTFWLGVLSTVCCVIMGLFIGFGKPPTTLECFYLVMNGFLSWLGQCAIQWALYYESASILSMVRTLDVAISFALSAMFLNDKIYWTSIVGATLICLVVFVIVLSNYLQEKFCKKKPVEVQNAVINTKPIISKIKARTSTNAPQGLDNKKSFESKSDGA